MNAHAHPDSLVIAGKTYGSRLLTGTGKFKDLEETRLATEAAGARIVTVAIRRTPFFSQDVGQNPGEPNLLDVLPPDCYSAEDAVSTCRLARELLDGQNLIEIIEDAKVPIIVDAGVGTGSDAAIAMELGCDGVLMNSAIAGARNPVLMAGAMRKAVEAGREAFLAGRIPRKRYASASSPLEEVIG